jgi:hypothetical protein
LSANSIDTIPEDFGKHMYALENLLLSYNNIQTVPDTIVDITTLKCLDLIGNNMFEVPPALQQKQEVRDTIRLYTYF